MTVIFGKDVELAVLSKQLGRGLGTYGDRVFGYTAEGTFEDIAEDVLRAAVDAYVPVPAPPTLKDLVANIRAATTLEMLREAVASTFERGL
jgi:hypothetical protein